MQETWDYIIVGGGTAGCVLANRLTADNETRVVVLEAGPSDTRPDLRIPSRYGSFDNSEVDWAYMSAPEPRCNGRRLPAPRGRTLGGSSSINAMIYVRGLPADFDEWDVPGWGWKDLLPAFIDAEDNERGRSEYHGVGGPVAVSDGRSQNVMMSAFVEAAVQAGLPPNPDFNGEQQFGAGPFQLMQRNGRRWSAADAYLHPVEHRSNLEVRTYTTVDRIRFEQMRATGVEARRLDAVTELRAIKGVIVCAGAFASPQLLQLSGIGPADHLRSLGIVPIVDHAGVGANLSDHPAVPLSWATTVPASPRDAEGPDSLAQYKRDQSGPSTSNLAEVGAFDRVGSTSGPVDIQWHAVPLPLVDGFVEGEDGIWIAPNLAVPESRGVVNIGTADPTTKPVIRFNHWTSGQDLEIMRAGIRRTLDFARQGALEPYCAAPLRTPASESNADLDRFIAANTMTYFHSSGTCALGDVVDPQLRVRGVEGLYVVDASVLPVVPRGNPAAAVIAVAERAAQIIPDDQR